MKKLIILAILGFGLTGLLMSQDREIDIFPEQVSIEHNEAAKKFSRDFVTTLADRKTSDSALNSAIGSSNQVALINLLGTNNVATILQSGGSNFASINLLGINNNATVNQDGNSNKAGVNILGSENDLSLNQQGNENTFNINFLGTGLNQEFNQIGNNLSFEFNGGGIPLSITQTGNNTGIIIENN